MEVVASAKISSESYREGSRVRVHDIKLPVSDTSNQVGKIVRIPKDAENDGCEITAYHLLRQYFNDFMPNAEILSVSIGDSIRNLLVCDKIETNPMNLSSLSNGFVIHLSQLPTMEEKIKFLTNLRHFVDTCKNFFAECASLPDLIGKGNVVCKGSDIYLLDFNNLSFKTPNDIFDNDNIHVPLDEKGYPIFDLSLRFLYRIERDLLSYNDASKKMSPKVFNSLFPNKNENTTDLMTSDLGSVMRTYESLKKDPFYGAVRHRLRREKANNLWEKVARRYFI